MILGALWQKWDKDQTYIPCYENNIASLEAESPHLTSHLRASRNKPIPATQLKEWFDMWSP